MTVASILIGLLVGVVAFFFGQMVGVPQPWLGIAAFVIFILIAFYGKLNNRGL